jgi:hypothetical protein
MTLNAWQLFEFLLYVKKIHHVYVITLVHKSLESVSIFKNNGLYLGGAYPERVVPKGLLTKILVIIVRVGMLSQG